MQEERYALYFTHLVLNRSEEVMIIVKLKCQMCGENFEAKLLDREDPQERHVSGSPVQCPRCNSTRVETIQRVRRAS